jgi:hypothetical protein
VEALDAIPWLVLAAPLLAGALAWRRLPRRAFALLSSSLVLALAAGEVALRASGRAHPVRAQWLEPLADVAAGGSAYQPGGELVYRYPSDPRGYFGVGGEVRGSINALGYRGAERPRARSEGVLRIAALGDSFTLGIGVRDEDTLPARLEARLRGVEVLNFGVSASDTPEQVRYLESYVAGFRPDLVLIVFFLNDAERAATMEFLTRPRALVGLREHSFLLNGTLGLLERALSRGAMRRHYLEGYAPTAPGWLRAREALREAREHCARSGARLALAVHPILVDLDDYPFGAIHATVLEFCAAERIPAVDLLPAFAGRHARELWVHENDQHPNELAHALAADLLAGFLVDRGLLPP